MSDFVTCLRLAQEVFEQYKLDHPKWWKRMDGTPILNDVAVLMAQKFVEHEVEQDQLITELADALADNIPPGLGRLEWDLVQIAREALGPKHARIGANAREMASGNDIHRV
jgi:hypothetical protein